MITLVFHLLRLLSFLIGGHRQLALENLALHQQRAVYKRLAPRPKLRPFRAGLATRHTRGGRVVVSPFQLRRSRNVGSTPWSPKLLAAASTWRSLD